MLKFLNTKNKSFLVVVIAFVTTMLILIVRPFYDNESNKTATPSTESVKLFFSLGYSKEDVYQAFGYSSTKGEFDKSIDIMMINLLKRNGVAEDLRAVLNSRSPCGARAHQAMMIEAKNKTFFVTYPCDDKCLGSIESNQDNHKTTSKTIFLDLKFCSSLWGGARKINDLDGL